MSATCIIYYGLRYDIKDDEIENLETRNDSRIRAARQESLKVYWGNFGSSNDHYRLFIGAQIGVLGPENQMDVQLSDLDFEKLAALVRTKLASAGLEGSPQLYVQWQDDV